MATVIFPPVSRVDEPVRSRQEERIEPYRREKVLVVDDELIVMDTIRRGLSRAGYFVDTASNEAELHELMQVPDRDYAAAILDIMMPDIVFEKAFDDLRLRFPRMPILVSSGYSDFGTEELLVNDDLVKFLTKPYRVGELVEALAEMRAEV